MQHLISAEITNTYPAAEEMSIVMRENAYEPIIWESSETAEKGETFEQGALSMNLGMQKVN